MTDIRLTRRDVLIIKNAPVLVDGFKLLAHLFFDETQPQHALVSSPPRHSWGHIWKHFVFD